MKRYLGIDLHTKSFTCWVLHADGNETIRTGPLQGDGLEQFLKACTRRMTSPSRRPATPRIFARWSSRTSRVWS